MNEKQLMKFKGKKVKIILVSNLYFTGIIVDVFPDSLKFEDKFNSNVLLNLDAIISVTEIKAGEGKGIERGDVQDAF